MTTTARTKTIAEPGGPMSGDEEMNSRPDRLVTFTHEQCGLAVMAIDAWARVEGLAVHRLAALLVNAIAKAQPLPSDTPPVDQPDQAKSAMQLN